MTTAGHPKSTGVKKSPSSVAKRAGWIALNIVLPAWEVSGMVRYTSRNIRQLWQRLRDVSAGRQPGDYRPESWEQAVADSGLPVERLRRNLRVNRRMWWGLMWLTGLPVGGFLLMSLLAIRALSLNGWLHIVSVLMIMLALSLVGFVQTLALSFRLWQLEEKRVTASEKGGFSDFLSETRWCRQVLSVELKSLPKLKN